MSILRGPAVQIRRMKLEQNNVTSFTWSRLSALLIAAVTVAQVPWIPKYLGMLF